MRIVSTGLIVTLCVIVCACGSTTPPINPPSTSPPPASTASGTDTHALTYAAATDFVARLNTIALGQSCRLAGVSRPAGRDSGYSLSAPRPVTVSTTTFSETVTLEPTTRSQWNSNQDMSVVVPESLRGKRVVFEATYDGITVIDETGPHPGGYGEPSAWPVVFTQVVTKTDYDVECNFSDAKWNLTHTVGVWDGLRLAMYPTGASAPVVIQETRLT